MKRQLSVAIVLIFLLTCSVAILINGCSSGGGGGGSVVPTPRATASHTPSATSTANASATTSATASVTIGGSATPTPGSTMYSYSISGQLSGSIEVGTKILVGLITQNVLSAFPSAFVSSVEVTPTNVPVSYSMSFASSTSPLTVYAIAVQNPNTSLESVGFFGNTTQEADALRLLTPITFSSASPSLTGKNITMEANGGGNNNGSNYSIHGTVSNLNSNEATYIFVTTNQTLDVTYPTVETIAKSLYNVGVTSQIYNFNLDGTGQYYVWAFQSVIPTTNSTPDFGGAYGDITKAGSFITAGNSVSISNSTPDAQGKDFSVQSLAPSTPSTISGVLSNFPTSGFPITLYVFPTSEFSVMGIPSSISQETITTSGSDPISYQATLNGTGSYWIFAKQYAFIGPDNQYWGAYGGMSTPEPYVVAAGSHEIIGPSPTNITGADISFFGPYATPTPAPYSISGETTAYNGLNWTVYAYTTNEINIYSPPTPVATTMSSGTPGEYILSFSTAETYYVFGKASQFGTPNAWTAFGGVTFEGSNAIAGAPVVLAGETSHETNINLPAGATEPPPPYTISGSIDGFLYAQSNPIYVAAYTTSEISPNSGSGPSPIATQTILSPTSGSTYELTLPSPTDYWVFALQDGVNTFECYAASGGVTFDATTNPIKVIANALVTLTAPFTHAINIDLSTFEAVPNNSSFGGYSISGEVTNCDINGSQVRVMITTSEPLQLSGENPDILYSIAGTPEGGGIYNYNFALSQPGQYYVFAIQPDNSNGAPTKIGAYQAVTMLSGYVLQPNDSITLTSDTKNVSGKNFPLQGQAYSITGTVSGIDTSAGGLQIMAFSTNEVDTNAKGINPDSIVSYAAPLVSASKDYTLGLWNTGTYYILAAQSSSDASIQTPAYFGIYGPFTMEGSVINFQSPVTVESVTPVPNINITLESFGH